MTDPSDCYTWRDFIVDLAKHGCNAMLYAGVPTIVRSMPDGRTLRTPITTANVESRIYETKIRQVLDRLEIDPAAFF